MFHKAFENLARHWATTVPTIIVLALVLTMFHGLLVVNSKASETLRVVSQKFSVTFYLKDSADPFEVGNLITALEARSDITHPVTYTSKEAAWELMVKSFALDPNLLKKYKFSLPASLTVQPRHPDDTARIEEFLAESAAHLLKDPISTKEKQKNITRQMLEFISEVRQTTLQTIFFFIVLFILGGTLLMASTIHLAMTSRRLEMGIMKLVGASYKTITTPFVIEGFLLSVLAFGLHMVLLLLLPLGLKNTSKNLNALLFEFVAVCLLGILVSHFTARFHLRKKII